MYAQDNNSLPVWIILSPAYHHISTNSQPFLVGIVSRTKVRKYLKTTDAQAVWKEYSEYMTTASKGASEKRKLTQYVTNTVLDRQFRGTSQQFVLHFNEEFWRLDELKDLSERMPESIKMALL